MGVSSNRIRMKSKFTSGSLALFFGVITLVLFSMKPYLLEFVEPSKSIGQIIGENAKDLIDVMNDKRPSGFNKKSKRETWSDGITLVSFLFFTITIIYASLSIQKKVNLWLGVGGALLAILGLFLFLIQLTMGMITLAVVALLVVLLVLGGAS